MGQGRRPPTNPTGPNAPFDGKRPLQSVRPGAYNIPNAAGNSQSYMPPVNSSYAPSYTLPPPQLGGAYPSYNQPPRIKFNVAAAKAPIPITLAAQSMSSTPYQIIHLFPF